jgi:hypothetical protein
MKLIFCVAGMLILCSRLQAQRQIISLNGVWQIEDSADSLPVPTKYTHQADLPGLVRTSVPAFPDVDRFVFYDYNNYEANPRRGSYDISDPKQLGVSLQRRNYFWYRRTFALKHRTPTVVLKVIMVQFGSAIWINHHYAGRNLSGCTAGTMTSPAW